MYPFILYFLTFKILKQNTYILDMQSTSKYQPVKDYAVKNNITVQAVYERIKKGKVLIKKIGTYTLVSDK